MSRDHCLQHLRIIVLKVKIVLPAEILGPNHQKQKIILGAFDQLKMTRNWANGRDVETLAKNVIAHVFMNVREGDMVTERKQLFITFEELLRLLLAMLEEHSSMNGLASQKLLLGLNGQAKEQLTMSDGAGKTRN
jgi:hypothetical protein